MLSLFKYTFYFFWGSEKGWRELDVDSDKKNYLILTRRKTGTNALIDVIYMLLTEGAITFITKTEIKDAILGHAPITKVDMKTSTVYICHDFPFFWKKKIELFDRIIITHREINATLTSSLDYYFVRRKTPILPCPFDVLLLRNWQYFVFEKGVSYLKAGNFPFKQYDFTEIGNLETIKDINTFLDIGKSDAELSKIEAKISDLRSNATIFNNGIMSTGGFANPNKEFPDWQHLEPMTFMQKFKMKLLQLSVKHD